MSESINPWLAVLLASIPGAAAFIVGVSNKRGERAIERDKALSKERQDGAARTDDISLQMRRLVSTEQETLIVNLRAESDRRAARLREVEVENIALNSEVDRLRDLARWWNEAAHAVRHAAMNEATMSLGDRDRLHGLDAGYRFDPKKVPALPKYDAEADTSALPPLLIQGD